MKHIKLCKPKSNAAIQGVERKMELKKAKDFKVSMVMAAGHGCVPTGNIIDRD